MSGSNRSRGQRGLALLLVIWALTLMATVASSFVGETGAELRIAGAFARIADARAVAEGGVALAALRWLDTDPATAWLPDGKPHEATLGDARLVITLADEGGKVDVNTAPPELVLNLLTALGADPGSVAAAGRLIAERRDGPPADDGSAAAPFPSAAAMVLAAGIPPAVLARVAPFLTVYSHRARVNPLTAPREVLLAIPGIVPAEVDRFIAARSVPPRDGEPPLRLAGADRFVAPLPPEAATVRVTARIGTARFTREAVIAATREPSRPYRLTDWHEASEPDPGEDP